jgi:hypothetical protein
MLVISVVFMTIDKGYTMSVGKEGRRMLNPKMQHNSPIKISTLQLCNHNSSIRYGFAVAPSATTGKIPDKMQVLHLGSPSFDALARLTAGAFEFLGIGIIVKPFQI